MQATVQATTKNIGNLQETSTDENTVIASKFAQLCTSGNVASVDGMQEVPSRFSGTSFTLMSCEGAYGERRVRSRGKSVTKRTFSAPTSRATHLSNPIANPPWGGIP